MKKTLVACLVVAAWIVVGEEAHDHDKHDSCKHTHEHEKHEHEHEKHTHDEHEKHEHDEHEHEHEATSGVEVSDAAAALIGLETVRAEKRVLEACLTLPARVVQNPKAQQSISARTEGFVSYTAVAPQRVHAGETLFEFTSPEAAAKLGELRALEARVAALQATGAKNAQLKSDLVLAQVAYTARTNGLIVVSAEEGRFAQRASSAGRIDGFEVASGAFVERGATLARFRADLPPSVLARVPVGDARSLADGQAAEVAGVHGTILVDRARTDGLVDVWFTAGKTAPGLTEARLGESVRMQVQTAVAGQAVVAIPASAIFRQGITPTVLVRDAEDPDRFNAQPVSPGRTVNGWTEVTDLAAGTEVVVQGLNELRQALPSRGESKRVAGHFHADGKFHAGGHDDED